MKLTRLYLFFALALGAFGVSAQTKSIDIWQGNVPGAIENPTYILQDDTTGGWSKMSKVSTPMLDFYPAPADIATGTAVVICPGGGYWLLAYKHEGIDIAKWFNKMGVSAFILKYRLPDNSIMKDKSVGPLQDAQEAIRIVRRNAKDWNIDSNKIGIMGFSAGGHLASTASTHFDEKVYHVTDSTSARPNFSLLIYPVVSMDPAITHMGSHNNLIGENATKEQEKHFSNELQVTEQTPPAFLVHSLNDNVVPVQNSINYALAMKNFKTPCELHIYETGGHGYGLGRSNGTESAWPEACKKWLTARGLL